jgi:hypothetical protein
MVADVWPYDDPKELRLAINEFIQLRRMKT